MMTDMRGGIASGRDLKTAQYQGIDLLVNAHPVGWSEARVQKPLALVDESAWLRNNGAACTPYRNRSDLQRLKTARHALRHLQDGRTPASTHIEQAVANRLARKLQEVHNRSTSLAHCDKVASLRTIRMKRHSSRVHCLTDEVVHQ